MSTKKDDRSDLEIAKDIVATHGHNLLGKVARYFRQDGWDVRLGQFYVDASTDKAREIDLIAAKALPIADSGRTPAQVNVRLFIECKYIPSDKPPTVFWFEEMDKESALEWIVRHTPLRKDAYFDAQSTFIQHHHYFKQENLVARLWADKGGKGDDTESMYKALNQCLNGYVHLRHSIDGGKAHLSYPLIVCSDLRKFFRTTIDASSDPVPIDDNFRLEVNYAYPGKEHSVNEYLQVEVVDFSKLQEFLDLLQAEIQVVGKALRQRKNSQPPPRPRSRSVMDW